jgi:predicted ATPase
MAIRSLSVTNFKGIGGTTTFDIHPITLFVGANSSGKSSCLHALMSLAQTLKLGNSAPALVLDDDFAHVHLGRFIEIAHSHSYSDAIAIGVNIGHRAFPIPRQKGTEQYSVEGNVQAEYSFRSTLRTQEVYVDTAKLAIGDRNWAIKRGAKRPYMSGPG